MKINCSNLPLPHMKCQPPQNIFELLKPSSSIFDLPGVRVPKIITSLLHPTQETNFGMEFGEKTLNASIIIPLVTIVVNSLNHNCLLDMNYNPSRGCPTMKAFCTFQCETIPLPHCFGDELSMHGGSWAVDSEMAQSEQNSPGLTKIDPRL